MNRKALWAAAAVPVLGIAALIARGEVRQRLGVEWLIGIQGYDPRDLLSGHFLRYQYSFDWSGADSCGAVDDGSPYWDRTPGPVPPRGVEAGCCVCLTRRGQGLVEPHARLVSCADVEREGCDGSLAAAHVSGPQKYFVPEDWAPALEKAMRERKPALLVSVRPGEPPAVKELYLDGRPWREAMNGASVPLDTQR